MVSFCAGKPVSLFLEKEDGFRPDLEKVKELANRRTKMLVLNTPHNPTGAVFDRKCLKAISEIFGGVILVDEVYENFTYGGQHHSLASLADLPENVITVNSFSKTYCMCGYRVGYLHASVDLIKQMMKLKLCVSTCTSSPAQHAAIAALEDNDFPGTIRKKFEERRNLLVKGLKALGLPLVEPKGAFYVFPDIKEFGSDEQAFDLFLKAGVLTMPGSVFHERFKENTRFSFVADMHEIREGIRRLEGILA
jgi:aspartate/methionine/tyrosine aminotransferase